MGKPQISETDGMKAISNLKPYRERGEFTLKEANYSYTRHKKLRDLCELLGNGIDVEPRGGGRYDVVKKGPRSYSTLARFLPHENAYMFLQKMLRGAV